MIQIFIFFCQPFSLLEVNLCIYGRKIIELLLLWVICNDLHSHVCFFLAYGQFRTSKNWVWFFIVHDYTVRVNFCSVLPIIFNSDHPNSINNEIELFSRSLAEPSNFQLNSSPSRVHHRRDFLSCYLCHNNESKITQHADT